MSAADASEPVMPGWPGGVVMFMADGSEFLVHVQQIKPSRASEQVRP